MPNYLTVKIVVVVVFSFTVILLLKSQWRKFRNGTGDNCVLDRGRVTSCGVKKNRATPQGGPALPRGAQPEVGD